MVRYTLVSLPGTARAEMTTVSPFTISTSGWSRDAIRARAESGSPWLPVDRIVTRSGGQQSDVVRLDQQPVRYVQIAEVLSDVDILDHAAADDGQRASVTCAAVHDLLDAVDVARERGDDDPARSQREDASREPAPRSLSGVVKPGVSALVLSDSRSSTPLLPQFGEPLHRRRPEVDGRLVELEVPGVHDRARPACGCPAPPRRGCCG